MLFFHHYQALTVEFKEFFGRLGLREHGVLRPIVLHYEIVSLNLA